ncbi:Bug family tripartite tricarboxylate transporter substrate binding protein [Ideonella livida]|uniref:Tripartite tricarboxylate transporter substrate binding protein n=1 Tax=Ideonella livida TaxID=2707176 RepID=A0A7C9PKK8_9BURK|nr:tripartite tricarboxylate transporter substrate binding protein [Ideonella livida]NDY93450.1 tripartite tricarboxylate transporter substrate binding protein [Ideonella livida]
MQRRTFLSCLPLAGASATGLGSLATTPAALAADAWPAKPITLIVPFPPGGPTDIIGRTAAKLLSDRLGQPVVVENRPGAGGNLGTDQIAKAAPDGYVLGVGVISSLSIAPQLLPKLPYNVKTAFTPVSMLGIAKGAIVAHPSAPFHDLKGLIAYAKAHPKSLPFGSSGIGTSNHLAGEYLQSLAGIELVHVPYKGTSQAAQDLLGGQLLLSFETSLATTAPNVQAGKLKAIAITAATRSPLLPQVPTVAEQGFPGFDVPSWFGLIGPAGLPKDVVATLNRVLTEGLKRPDVAERFAQIGAEPAPSSPEQFAKRIADENQRWGQVIRDAHITLD